MNDKEFNKKERQKLIIVGAFCFVAIISIIGYTYSYFTTTATNTGTITGTVASASLSLNVTKVAPDIDKALVPQLDSAIASAVVGTQGSCIDDNLNAVCQVYQITVKNTGTSSINVDGFVELDVGDNPNLKWAIISNPAPTKPTLLSGHNSYIRKTLTTNETYTANQEKTYYMVVWISEKEIVQEDTGIFSGTVIFKNAESPALATLTKLNLDDDYVGEISANNMIDETTCIYDGNGVVSFDSPSQENCNTIYKVNLQDGSVGYFDYTFSQMAIYQGEGTWDSNNSVCLYEGNQVFDFNITPIASEENCGSVYKIEVEEEGEIITLYLSGVELLEGESGIYVDPETILNDGIFSAEDDLGTSYFFRGNVENNYVQFAGYYWRIIRINGDGTVRMIYDGTSAHDNGTSSTDRQITQIAFNASPNYNDNTYVGYMYGTPGVTATGVTGYNQTHLNSTDSTIKTYLEDTWYANNIKGTEYEKYIADAIYCNDRSLDTSDASYTGIGTTQTQYAAFQRLASPAIPEPTLKCKNQNDRFTYNANVGGVLGNDKLEAPIGLITADEVILAGALYTTSNPSYYLYSGNGYWTMSPSHFGDSNADEFNVSTSGYLNVNRVDNSTNGVRAVLTLESDALKYSTNSNGTINHPFTVTG